MKKVSIPILLVSLILMYGGYCMPQEPFLITASFPLDEGGLGYILRIDQLGNSELKMETNVEKPEVNAIGVYQISIGQERAQELRKNLNLLSKRPFPKSPEGPPGTPMVRVALEEGGKTEQRFVDPSTSTPAMCQVADQIKKVGEDALKNPVQVIRMSASLDQAEIGRSAKLKVVIRLTADGAMESTVNDPLQTQSKTRGFTVWGVRSDLPVTELWPQHSIHQKLTTEYLTKADVPKDPMEPGCLTLKPSQKAEYQFEVPISWEPGAYAVRLIFETSRMGGKALRGNILSMPVQLKVK
ncbi:MAG: hypothetical protein FJ117_02180 [Deltaproteobacteria bacterium]|nr:hypothetical protein [Deltaproteobacteria bacterium]